MMLRPLFVLGLALSATLPAPCVGLWAQTPGVERGDRWSISILPFWTLGGPDDHLRSALVDQHFGDTIPASGSLGGGVSPALPTPASLQGRGPGWAVAVGYRLAERVDIELSGNRAVRMTEVLGFNLGAGARLNLHAAVAAWGVTTGLHLGPLRVRAGPMYYRTHVRTEEQWALTEDPPEYLPAEHDEEGGVGALLGADIVHPVGDRILILARAQLRWVGERSVGPYQSVGWSGERVSFGREPIGFNHGVLMVGVGIRL